MLNADIDIDADADGEPDVEDVYAQQPESKPKLTLKLRPPMARSVQDGDSMALRRSTRRKSSTIPSGSEYSAGNASASASVSISPRDAAENGGAMDEDLLEDNIKPYTTKSGRLTSQKTSYIESDDDGALGNTEEAEIDVQVAPSAEALFDDSIQHPRITRSKAKTRTTTHQRVLSEDDEEDEDIRVERGSSRYSTRSRSRKLGSASHDDLDTELEQHDQRPRRITRASSGRGKSARQKEEEDVYEDNAHALVSSDDEEDMDLVHTSPEVDVEGDPDEDGGALVGVDEGDVDRGGKPYAFRRRTKQINYAIPPPLNEIQPMKRTSKSKGKPRGPGWSANGTELARYMGGLPHDDSDSDYPTRTPRKPFGAGGGGNLFAAGGGGMFPNDLSAAAGTPSNLGRISDAALADADPLGVNQNVTFDEVGGLDDHINALKEMTLLPLLYPEVFQRFNLTPPRGVLFHGPPGTGKTLLARALAASCRSNGKGISFFMRKGADCLSKWVGEAERQLRLLFEEARNQQPSIIFFDEIDGLAPVRSSKQDQIHASIVSTLLALMDGMDGRGQVIVIGATNRPDAVDPALRRPGRFDREFYFALPNLEARKKILRIITKKWEGWGDSPEGSQMIEKLASLTRGYGGADLRALCTEAALNAVQRRYPQIYKSNDRLLLKPETIGVQARDFMISVKKLVPSSARSTATNASPVPPQLEPLLEETFASVRVILEKALPLVKKRTALEEAEWEDDGDENTLDRELMMQSMETLRVHRPRVVLHGPPGMGQEYVGAAALHHLEGCHVQTLDLGTLMGDSTRTAEAAIVQLFVEAKRHQPSVIYIPSLLAWCGAITESTRMIVRSMLDSLSPSDPVLMIAVVDGPFEALPRDVRSWFGMVRENRIAMTYPSPEKRRKFFHGLMIDLRRPPNQFPDGIKRKRRVLEDLPIAPPIEPRQPTAAELAIQEENDQRIVTLLKYRLGPILTELKRKFKRFTKRASDEYNLNNQFDDNGFPLQVSEHVVPNELQPEGVLDIQATSQDHPQNGMTNGRSTLSQEPKLYAIDLEKIHFDLYKGKYLTPQEFLDDIGKIAHNAEIRAFEDADRVLKAQAMFTAAQVSIQEFDPQLRLECERMVGRERKRRDLWKEARAKARADADADAARGAEASERQENGSYAPGTRRSGRNNGQLLEVTITDPERLVRDLKRQRSADANGQSSSEESVDRASKRSKVNEEDDPDLDPLNVVDLPMSSQPRHLGVRFTADVMQTPTRISLSEAQSHQVDSTLTFDAPSDLQQTPVRMDHLLNPAPLAPLHFHTATPSRDSHPASLFSANDSIMFLDLPESRYLGPTAGEDTLPLLPINGDLQAADLALHSSPIPNTGQDQQIGSNFMARKQTEQSRTPSPPLPIFHVNDESVVQLDLLLVDMTARFTVEQLEQLRATCLNCVWRHRQEWNRDALIYELRNVTKDFADEVNSLNSNYYDESS